MVSQAINTSLIQQWLSEKLDVKKVEQNLLSLGYDEITQLAYLKEFKKNKNAVRQRSGFVYLGIGGFLGFISCVLTLTNPVPELYNWILFGLTSISILLICRGLYNVFE
jgi:aryl carrier-like protein